MREGCLAGPVTFAGWSDAASPPFSLVPAASHKEQELKKTKRQLPVPLLAASEAEQGQ